MKTYDVVIVGSGATGGWSAMTLAKAGLRVLVLEAGPARPGKAPKSGRQAVQSRCYAYRPETRHLFVDDVDNAYTTPTKRPFSWIRSRQAGGRTLLWGGAALRFSDSELKDWPLGYADLAPHYARAERALKVRELPLHGPFKRRWKSRRVVPARFSDRGSMLHAALATGRAELRSDAVVSRVKTDPMGKARGVVFFDRKTGRREDVQGRVVLICASAIESARLLLNSGICNSSGLLGRNLTDHPMVAVSGRAPRKTAADAYVHMPGYGVRAEIGGGRFNLTAFLEQSPRPENRVTLDKRVKDAWGVPAARIDCRYSDSEVALAKNAVDSMVEMAREVGLEVEAMVGLQTPGTSIHEGGTARMGDDPRTSVLDPFCRSWDVRNLFVADGSCFVSSGYQNPMLTLLALADRCSRHIVDEFKRGVL